MTVRSLSRTGNRPRPVMNVTPLVDVVLVLLIIFMVVIPAMQEPAEVELPSIFNVDKEAKGKVDPFMLSVSKEGALYFEQTRLDPARLEATLRNANLKEPTRRLIVRADRAAKYGMVRQLFKVCQEVGFPGVSLKVNEMKKGEVSATGL